MYVNDASFFFIIIALSCLIVAMEPHDLTLPLPPPPCFSRLCISSFGLQFLYGQRYSAGVFVCDADMGEASGINTRSVNELEIRGAESPTLSAHRPISSVHFLTGLHRSHLPRSPASFTLTAGL